MRWGSDSRLRRWRLSEVARADRVEAFLTEDERAKLLVEAQHWFINISDYRGFDDDEGWRHAVAHGSDLLMQLVLNPKVDEEGLARDCVGGRRAGCAGADAYIHGESGTAGAADPVCGGARGDERAGVDGVVGDAGDAEGCGRRCSRARPG